MSAVGKIVGKVVGGMTGASQAAKGAGRAAATQSAAAQAGIDEQRRQFDKIVELMLPFIESGTDANQAQSALAGLDGPEAYEAAIAGIEGGPEFQSLLQQGEEALLQNASATGGLRGGNLQGALAQFRPEMLSQLINQRFGRLGTLANRGQSSAAMQATAGGNTASNISNLLQQQGAAVAGGQMAKAGVPRLAFQDLQNTGATIFKALSGGGF